MSFQPDHYITEDIKAIPPSGIRKFFDLCANSKDIISLGVGEPDFVSPWTIREACVYSLEKGYTMYTSNYGMLELRQEIVRYLYERFGLCYDENKEVIVTVGASEAIDMALRTLINPGDEVLIPEPCYVSYQACTLMSHGKPVMIPTTAEKSFKLTPADIEAKITPKSKVLMLSFPNNPTGAVLTEDELLALAEVVKKHDLIVISDEIYSELTYEQEPVSFASLPDMKERTILVSGLSKAFAMTGWRVGYIACDAEFIQAMVKIHQYTILCAPIMGQMAAIEAFRNGIKEVVRMRTEYDHRRRYIVKKAKDIGLDMVTPEGAFYAFPSIEKFGMDCETFATRLLQEKRVAVVPGNAFGKSGEGFIRCSYATSMKQIEEAFHRIDQFING
ncbi:MAG TPA: aminotransferase class I/II-fold pyridoxal phosphate-dependent enzyme [Clostridiales bacterium]|nr:aminotransferase class I/II-fold pyridoxal phosphate-dependent enzyme [Clostridiales bacterium]